jgi:RNA polymerase sigma-70 factor (ECF subfamily)
LLAYIRKHLGTALGRKVEVDDVLQELTLEALRRAGELSHTDRDPFGWLCQIADQRMVDIHRRYFSAQKRSANREIGFDAPGGDARQTPLINLLVASITSPSQAFSRDQKEFRLQEMLATLPDESREALRLRYVDGLATKEIAERMGKSDGSVRVLLTRSLSKLQSLLGDGDASPGKL